LAAGKNKGGSLKNNDPLFFPPELRAIAPMRSFEHYSVRLFVFSATV
jgi:hypothetical protein